MTDPRGTSVPPVPPQPAPQPGPPRRYPFVTFLLVLIGVILLLPGLCAIILFSVLPGRLGYEEQLLALACGVGAIIGIGLIVWAVRRP